MAKKEIPKDKTAQQPSSSRFVSLGSNPELYDFRAHFHFFHPAYRHLVLGAMLISLLLGAVALLESFALKSLADLLLDGSSILTVFGAPIDIGIGLIPFFFFIIATQIAGGFTLDLLQARLMIEVRDNVEILVVKNIALQPLERMRTVSVGDLIGKLATDLPRAMIYREQVIIIVTAMLTILAYGAFVAYHSIILALTIIVLAFLGALINHLMSREAASIDREFRAASDTSRIHIDELVRGAREIRANALIERTLGQFAKHLDARRRPFMRLSYYLARMRASNAAWPSLAIVLVITIMGGLAGRISPVSDLALLPPLFFIIFAVFKDVKQIVEAVVDLTLVRNSFQRLAAYQLPIPDLLDWVDIGESETPLQSVEFDAVGYSYDADPVDGVKGRGLENISLQLNIPGWVALTGPSGSGKSTFLDLLIREILPHRGDIRYSPGPRHVTRAQLPRHISFMPQSPSLFRGSVRDNLSIQLPARLQDQPNAWLSNKSLITLLQASGLAERLSSKACSLNPDLAPDDALRAGLELDIGLFNSGWSGGEVKLIGLVRCLASGAEVVVLDEPTASLDESASITVAELLRNEATTRLVLTVTHDPILRQFADRVIELENGRLRPL